MRAIIAFVLATRLLASVRKLGGLGLFLMGVLDSSFLFFPFGNDLLLISLVSSRREGGRWIWYVILSALGSVLGVLLVDLVMRKLGEEGLERFVKPEKVKRLKKKMEKRAGWALFLATILPPPFPFTAFVLTASALQTPRKVILGSVFLGRLVRFTIEAALALAFGRQILRVLDSDAVEYAVYVFLAVAVVGSGFSIYKWVGRRPGSRARQAASGD